MSGARKSRQSVLRREHLVAASLVGTVVVVVGFASGLGLTRTTANASPTTSPSQQKGGGEQPATGDSPAGSGAGSAGGGAGSAGGSNYVGVAEPGTGSDTGVLGGAPPIVVTTTGSQPGSTIPPTSSEPPTTDTSPPATVCTPGMVFTAVNGAVGVVTGLAGDVPIVGPLVGGLGLPSPSTNSPSATPTTAINAGLGDLGGLGDLVSGLTGTLLGTCSAPTPAATGSGTGS